MKAPGSDPRREAVVKLRASWWRSPEGLELLAKIAGGGAALLGPGLVGAVLGQVPILGRSARPVGVVLIFLGAASAVTAFAFTVALAVAKRRMATESGRAERERLVQEREARLKNPIAALKEVSPYSLGVDTEAIELERRPEAADADRYMSRDRDADLRKALDQALDQTGPPMVVVQGPSKAGKSRTLFEALSRHPTLRLAMVVAPKDPEALTWLLERGHLPDRLSSPVVLWLDDLELFVQVGKPGFSLRTLDELARWEQRVVVVATAGGKGAQQAVDTKLVGPLQELLRQRQVLAIPLASEMRPAELLRVRARYSAAEAERIQRHGIGEVLVAVEDLTGKLQSERHPGDPSLCPQGAAVTWTAIDWSRSGMLRPLSAAMLEELWVHYASGSPMTVESFERGLEWALRPIHRTAALLREEPARNYQAYDPVVAQAGSWRAIEASAWERIFEIAAEAECFELGRRAYERSASGSEGDLERNRAQRAMRRASGSDDPDVRGAAVFNLGVLLHERGDLEGAEAAFRYAEGLGPLERWSRSSGSFGNDAAK